MTLCYSKRKSFVDFYINIVSFQPNVLLPILCGQRLKSIQTVYVDDIRNTT